MTLSKENIYMNINEKKIGRKKVNKIEATAAIAILGWKKAKK